MEFELRTNKANGRRAVNKPITVLWMLGQYTSSGTTTFQFADIESVVGEIIQDYTRLPNISDPFWRLRRDDILKFPDEMLIGNHRSGNPIVHDLRKYGQAHFTSNFESFISSPENLIAYAEWILDSFFTEGLDDDILFRVGLTYRHDLNLKLIGAKPKRKRDPKFRDNVATAYNHQCAVCGFSLLMGNTAIANEAAHIRWHSYGGPDVISNGIFLCNLHHRLFDRGVIGFSDHYEMIISDRASSASDGFKRWILDFDGRSIDLPRKVNEYPAMEYLDWHRKEVLV